MSTYPFKHIFIIPYVVLVTILLLGPRPISAAPQTDPISDYINQINPSNLSAVATNLVTLYGPRRSDSYSPYDDANCTQSDIVYPKTTIEMSSDYVKGLFEAMGYSPSSITMEVVPGGVGRNVYVTKVGSTYPNIYIEFGAHLDTVSTTPGGNDNASGVTAVIELARVLKDYPSRYSIRFALWVAEEYDAQRGAYYGSHYHVEQALARGEQIKAALVMDHIGWPDPSDPTGLMNEVSYDDAESERIADLFNSVRFEYQINIGFGKDQGIQNSDEHSFWNLDQTAVSSGGGWLYYRPNYHGCGDTVSNINFTNVLRVAQQNLAVGLKLDEEVIGATPTPTMTPTPTVAGSITMGETSILSNDDDGNGGYLLAQQVSLSQDATVQSMSFYITSPVGRLRFGIYDDASGKPGALKAQTAEITPVVGWNTQNVLSPVYLTAGTYWLAYLPESNDLHFRMTFSGSRCKYIYPYGALPALFSISPQCGAYHWSFYASLLTGSSPTYTPAPTATNTPTLTPTNTPTATNMPTATDTQTATATNTQTATATNTQTATATNTQTATNTPAVGTTETATDTPSATNTPTLTPTNTPIPPTPTATNTPTPTSSLTYTPTRTRTPTPTGTSSPTRTPTATSRGTNSPTPTRTRTPTRTGTNSPTPSKTRTQTPTLTNSPTPTTTYTPPPTSVATFTMTATPTTAGSITMGETSILSNDDYGNGGMLVAQQVTLSQDATVQSMSFYVASPAGRLRLGIYDDASGKPGALKAQTADITPVIGWNTQNVLSPIDLTAGTYWLVYMPESSNLHFRMTFSGSARWYSYPFGALPATFSTSPQSGPYHWSFYATLQ